MSDSREMSDLEWLARNVKSWQEPGKPYALVVATDDKRGGVVYFEKETPDLVYIEDWQSKRKRLGLDESPVEWDGEGLPSVGERVEYQTYKDREKVWRPAVVVGFYKGSAVMVDEESRDPVKTKLPEYRPLRTKEQRNRDEALEDIERIIRAAGRASKSGPVGITSDYSKALFEAGYRKQEPQS